MNILALDIATKTGWASSEGSGVWDFAPMRDESKGMRVLKFDRALRRIIKEQAIHVIAYERVAGFHKSSLIVMAQMVGAMMVICEEMNIEYIAYSAGTIKKFATGKGNAKKDAMVYSAKVKFDPIQIIDDNHADALWLYELASTELNS